MIYRPMPDDSEFGNIFDDIGDALKDFANTDVGKIVLRATAIAASAGIGPLVSSTLTTVTAGLPVATLSAAQIAYVSQTASFFSYHMAMAAPGMLAGKNFVDAYADEAAWRLKLVIQVVSVDQLHDFGEWVGNGTSAATKNLLGQIESKVGNFAWEKMKELKGNLLQVSQLPGDLPKSLKERVTDWNAKVFNSIPGYYSMTPDDLAIALGLSRVDCALEAMALATGEPKYLADWIQYSHDPKFDMATGRWRGQGSKLNDDYKSAEQIALEHEMTTSTSQGSVAWKSLANYNRDAILGGRDISSSSATGGAIAKAKEGIQKKDTRESNVGIPIAVGGGIGIAAGLLIGASATIVLPLGIGGAVVGWFLSKE